ncbi:hypothetical protein Scep_001975 [Stephania cephalantha]|uniref:Uncharacterized protein n=1 Tax=Stephania cephalantha TaxID=152367 RepID=A0AAP0LD24_9MAGN
MSTCRSAIGSFLAEQLTWRSPIGPELLLCMVLCGVRDTWHVRSGEEGSHDSAEILGNGADAHPKEIKELLNENYCWFVTWLQMLMWQHGIGGDCLHDVLGEGEQLTLGSWKRKELVKVCEICGDYSHSGHDCPYYLQYENYHYSSYASPQPDFLRLMSNPQIPERERNQQFRQSNSLEDMTKQFIDSQQQFQRLLEELRQIDFEIQGLKDLETQFIQYNAKL